MRQVRMQGVDHMQRLRDGLSSRAFRPKSQHARPPRHTIGRHTAACMALTIVLACLALAYQAKGYASLVVGDAKSSAIDLRQKWVEHRYFLHGVNPFDIWMQHGPWRDSDRVARFAGRPPAPYSESIGFGDPANPPWAYPGGLLWFWPSWPVVRIYYALLNFAASITILGWAWNGARVHGTRAAGLVCAACAATSAAGTAVDVGQYSLLITGLLVLVLQLDRLGRAVPAGVLLLLALAKPTLSVPFLLAVAANGRIPMLAAVASTGALATLMTWWWLATDPVTLLRQLSVVGEYLAPASQLSFQSVATDVGLGGGAALAVPVLACTALLTVPLVRLRSTSLTNLFAFSAVAARLWTYHRPYDDVILIFLLVPLLLRYYETEDNWIGGASLCVGLTLWSPGRLQSHSVVQAVQLIVWVGAAIALYRSLLSDLPSRQRAEGKGSAANTESPI